MAEVVTLTDLANRFGWYDHLGEPNAEVVGRVIEHEYLLGHLPVGRQDSYRAGSTELGRIIQLFRQIQKDANRGGTERRSRRRKKKGRVIMANVATETKGKRKSKKNAEEKLPRQTRSAPDGMVTVQDLAREFGYQPQYLRKLLRDAREAGEFEHAARTRYQWEDGSDGLAAVRDLITKHQEEVNTLAEEDEADED